MRAAKAKFEKSSHGNIELQKRGNGVAKTPTTISQATVFFLMGDSSKGSGFFTKLWGKPVILTSAQAFALAKNPRIINSDSRDFPVRAAIIHKNLDLAILEPEPGSVPKDMPFLKITPKLSMNEIDSTTDEYCDISGNQKFGKRAGKLLAIRKGKIEIEYTIDPQKDPLINASNSGGPILNHDGNVIGVSTYLWEPSIREIFEGTWLFSRKGWKSGAAVDKKNHQGIMEIRGERVNTGQLEAKIESHSSSWTARSLEFQDCTYYTYRFKTIFKVRCAVPRVDDIKLDGFELFDKVSQEKDLTFYKEHQGIMQQCINEVWNPHYNWTLAWPWKRSMPIKDFKDISNYLYCYDRFSQIDWNTYFNYRASLSTLQHFLDFQQKVYTSLVFLLHVNPIQLTEMEKDSALQIVSQLKKDRKDYFICPHCLGAREIKSYDMRGIRSKGCFYCEGVGRAAVRFFYGPWRLSPLYPFPRSPWVISGFRLGMPLSEANKAAHETWRSDTKEYNIINLNGIFDCVRVGRNPAFGERALRTELKFVARRLSSIAVTFEHDQHNFGILRTYLDKKFGKPDLIKVPQQGEMLLLMYIKDDIVVTLCVDLDKIVLRAYHRILQHVEYLVMNSFEQKIFSAPIKYADEKGLIKSDPASYVEKLNFYP